MADTKTAGIDWLVQVLVTATQQSIAGQRGCTFNLDAEMVDTTTKLDSGWTSVLPGKKTWSIDADGLVIDDDTAVTYQELLDAITGDTAVTVQVLRPTDSYVWLGSAYVKNFPVEASLDDAATTSFSLVGVGAPTKAWVAAV